MVSARWHSLRGVLSGRCQHVSPSIFPRTWTSLCGSMLITRDRSYRHGSSVPSQRRWQTTRCLAATRPLAILLRPSFPTDVLERAVFPGGLIGQSSRRPPIVIGPLHPLGAAAELRTDRIGGVALVAIKYAHFSFLPQVDRHLL